MALTYRPHVVIVRNQTIKMKIFVYLCAFLPLCQGAVSSASSKSLYHYIVLNSDIKHIIQNVSLFMLDSGHRAHIAAKIVDEKIDILENHYGQEAYRHVKSKYEVLAAEFAKNPKLNQDCPQYVADILKENEQHQTELSNYLASTIRAWATEFDDLYRNFSTARMVLANVEKEAYDCGSLLKEDDTSLPYNCVVEALRKAKAIQTEAVEELSKQLSSLLTNIISLLTVLHGSVKDRSIPSFYSDNGHDEWLAEFCSE